MHLRGEYGTNAVTIELSDLISILTEKAPLCNRIMKKIPVTIRFTEPVHEWLTAESNIKKESISEVVRQIVTDRIKEEEKQARKK